MTSCWLWKLAIHLPPTFPIFFFFLFFFPSFSFHSYLFFRTPHHHTHPHKHTHPPLPHPVQFYQLVSEPQAELQVSMCCFIWSRNSVDLAATKTLYQKRNNLLRGKAHRQKKNKRVAGLQPVFGFWLSVGGGCSQSQNPKAGLKSETARLLTC